MSNATEAMAGRGNVLPAELGSKFIRWGLGLFLLGFVVGFIPIVHYIHGAAAGNVGPAFLKNVTLWWGIAFYVSGIAFAFGGIRRHHLGSDAVIPATPAQAGRYVRPDRSLTSAIILLPSI